MTRTGTLRYGSGEARIGGELVAIRDGSPNPFAAAKTSLVSQGFLDGQQVTVGGIQTTTGDDTPVFVLMSGIRRSVKAARRKVAKGRRKVAGRPQKGPQRT